MANVHCAAATRNFLALENHSLDVPWWQDLVDKPIIKNDIAVEVTVSSGQHYTSAPDESKLWGLWSSSDFEKFGSANGDRTRTLSLERAAC